MKTAKLLIEIFTITLALEIQLCARADDSNRRIHLDLGAGGPIGFSQLDGTPVDGTLSVDFMFSQHQFVRLYSATDWSFCVMLGLSTTGSGLVGFMEGSGSLLDARGKAIPGYGITGSASSDDGSMHMGLFPLFADDNGAPDTELSRPLDFYGVRFNIIFPEVNPSIKVTDGQFSLYGGPIGIGRDVPADIPMNIPAAIPTNIPEPSSLLFFGFGAFGLMWLRWHQPQPSPATAALLTPIPNPRGIGIESEGKIIGLKVPLSSES
jgi:hypothetical protein